MVKEITTQERYQNTVEEFVQKELKSIPTEWVRIVAESVGEFPNLPMWGTMWFIDSTWGERIMKGSALLQDDDSEREHFDEEMAGAHCILDERGSETAMFIYEVNGQYLIGVHGAGWNFYQGAWDVLYDLLGLQWHTTNNG